MHWITANSRKKLPGLDESSIEGKLPENMYDAVITSKDSSLIGTQMDIYFKSKKWTEQHGLAEHLP